MHAYVCVCVCLWCAHAVVHMWRPENNFCKLLTSFLHCGTQGWNSSCRVCMAMSLCFDPPHQHYFCSWRQGLIAPVALSSPYSRRWLWSPDWLPPKCWSHRHGPSCHYAPFTVHSILLWLKHQPWKEPQLNEYARAFLTWDVQKPRNHQGNLEAFSSILVAVAFIKEQFPTLIIS